jgi:transcriptional regulator with XRE-family HTH domain
MSPKGQGAHNFANPSHMGTASPFGQTTAQASRRRAQQSPEYQAELAHLAPYEEIARQVIRLRMKSNLSQAALADLVGTTKSAISRLESGHHAPTVATLRKIAAAFERKLVISFETRTAAPQRAAPAPRRPVSALAPVAPRPADSPDSKPYADPK